MIFETPSIVLKLCAQENTLNNYCSIGDGVNKIKNLNNLNTFKLVLKTERSKKIFPVKDGIRLKSSIPMCNNNSYCYH